MPTYSYKCGECGHAFDIHQSFSDDALTVCPECGGALHKVFGAVGVTFKGSGFYRTDSRSKKDTPASSESKPATSEKKTTEKKTSEKKSTSASAAGSAA